MMENRPSPSSTASTCSGTTTNPNTPRPEHDQEHPADKAPAGSSSPQPGQDTSPASGGDRDASDGKSSTSSSSDASRQRRQDIQPTWPRKVETKTKALAVWQPDRRLENIFLDLNWTPHNNSGSAFFKLRTGLRFTGGPSARRDGQVSVFVFIHPERIRRLSFDAEPDERPFGANTVALTFNMNRAPALVLPSTYDHVSPGGEEAIKSLRELTALLSFTVYTSLPRRTLPLAWLQQLCTAVTDHKISSILTCANLVRLYRGQGAQLLEGDILSQPVLDPPAYEDVGPGSPHAGESKGQKRRRRSSSDSTSGPVSHQMSHESLKALLNEQLNNHRREVLEILATHKSQVLQMLSDFRTEINNNLDSREEWLVADMLSGLVAEKVKEEMEEVQDRVMDTITSMPLQASLTFPEHHLY